jgi:hypothetical protein
MDGGGKGHTRWEGQGGKAKWVWPIETGGTKKEESTSRRGVCICERRQGRVCMYGILKK